MNNICIKKDYLYRVAIREFWNMRDDIREKLQKVFTF